MKNKNILIGIAAVAVVGIGAYLLIGKGSLPSITSPSSQQTTLKALLAAGINQTCTFTSQTPESSSSGQVYIGGGKMRGDFTSVTAGKTTESHLVVSNGIAYLWIDQPLQGFRMSFDSMNTKSGMGSGSVDANASVDYKCQPWNAIETKFDLPAGVNFQDMSAMIEQAAKMQAQTGANAGASAPAAGTAAGASAGTQSYAEQQCAACNMITDANAKAQCKASFDCR